MVVLFITVGGVNEIREVSHRVSCSRSLWVVVYVYTVEHDLELSDLGSGTVDNYAELFDVSLSMKGFVTLFTDASFSSQHKLGAWACWIKSDFHVGRLSGPFKLKVETSNEAEILAIANGIFLVVKTLKGIKKIHLVTDSDHALRVLGNRMKGSTKKEREVHKFIKTLLSDYRIKLSLKGIKGHSKGSSPREYVNRWCDVKARREMRKEVRRVNSKTTKDPGE